MDKKYIVRFLKEKRRGVYNTIVQAYSDIVFDGNVAMVIEMIKDDLARETGEEVDLNYNSLVHAIKKYKAVEAKHDKTLPSPKQKDIQFKDMHELPRQLHQPGKFKTE